MTYVHQTPLDLSGARIEGLTRLDFGKGLLEGSGILESPILETPKPFDSLVGSWNAQVPPGAAVAMLASARIQGTWTSWYQLPRWEVGSPLSFERQEDSWGFVETDTLKLKAKADAFRYRIVLEKQGRRAARLLQVAVSWEDFSAPMPDAAQTPPLQGPWVRELQLSPRSQMEEQATYRGDICSPTSLAMVLEFWGKKHSTKKIVQLVQDRRSGIYGNWTLNIAAASSLGLSGHVAWLSSLRELESQIASGRPVVVSIRFGDGELSGAPMRKTNGHLFVVVGFTPQGDVIVLDPAAPNKSSVRRVYRRDEFHKVWLVHKRGLAYVLGPRSPKRKS